MEPHMDRFIRMQNVERYRRLIENVRQDGSVTEETRRQMIFRLLVEEQQKQKDAGDKL